MHIDYDVPFASNTPDDAHCAQATLNMIVRYFEPSRSLSWAQLDEATDKRAATTWRMAGLLWLTQQGYDVHVIDTLDYAAWARDGNAYLHEYYGPDVAQWQIETSDIEAERERARTFATRNMSEQRAPTQADIERYLEAGYLVQVTVNTRRLNGLPGYWGHAVLVKGFDANNFIVHDPGLPPAPNRTVTRPDFEAAWADPSANAKHLSAIRKA